MERMNVRRVGRREIFRQAGITARRNRELPLFCHRMFDQFHLLGIQIEARTAIGSMALYTKSHHRFWRRLLRHITQMFIGKSMAGFALDIYQFHLLLLHVEAFGLFEANGVTRETFGIELFRFFDQRLIGLGMGRRLPLLT